MPRVMTKRALALASRTALVLAALAPAACATESGPLPGGADLFDEPVAASPLRAPDGTKGETSSPSQLASLQMQADDAYRARRFDEAVALYDRLLALQPSNAHAWLRLGNVHHQRQDWFKAISAYRRAAARILDGVENDPALRAKALYNVALIDLELARQSLRALERLGESSASAGDPAPLAREIERTQRRLQATSVDRSRVRSQAGAREAALPGSPPAEVETSAVAPPAAAPGSVPKGVLRSRTTRPSDDLPRVDYIRGEPRP